MPYIYIYIYMCVCVYIYMYIRHNGGYNTHFRVEITYETPCDPSTRTF